jgi:hypothetical protein
MGDNVCDTRAAVSRHARGVSKCARALKRRGGLLLLLLLLLLHTNVTYIYIYIYIYNRTGLVFFVCQPAVYGIIF